MTKFLLFFLLTAGVLFSQIPTGLSPTNFSKADLEKYGISEPELVGSEIKLEKENIEDKTQNDFDKKRIEKDKILNFNIPNKIDTSEVKKEDVYGKSFFNSNKLNIYNRATHIKAPPSYVLGSGDEINVSIWGYSEHSGVYIIGEDGSISPKRVGKIYLNGQTFEQAKKIISSKFGKVYDLRNSQITVKLNYSKVIRVNIVGEVSKPGTYTVPSINPVFNILSLAGGINKHGTIRNIEIRRNGKTVNHLDVYEFFKNPSYKSNFFLMDNDYIIVGMASKIVTLEGSVKKTSKYELKAEEGINKLIQYSGGFLPSAYTKTINLYRYQKNRLEIVDVKYDSLLLTKKTFLLKDGDRIFVSNVPEEIRNVVTIQGAINIPNSYVFRPGMKVKNLIEIAGGLMPDAYTPKAFLTRLNNDFTRTRIEVNLLNELNGKSNTTIQEFDSLMVYSKNNFKSPSHIEVLGAVRKPGVFDFTENLTLGDALFLSGGMLPEASTKRIEISRINNFNNSTDEPVRITVETIDVDMDLLSEIKKQVQLKPLDKVHVRLVPNYEKQQYVSIEGEVAFPGSYVISNKAESVLDLINRAGGVTEWAFLEGAYLKSEVGFIVFNLKDVLNKEKSEFNYIIKKGDKIIIPKMSNYINLSGSVNYPKVEEMGGINLPYKRGKSAKYYIKKYASGFSKESQKSNTYVETAGGYIKKTKNYLLFKKYPLVNNGDGIVVPQKKEKKRNQAEKKPIDWNTAIETLSIKLTGVATLFVILQSAFGGSN